MNLKTIRNKRRATKLDKTQNKHYKPKAKAKRVISKTAKKGVAKKAAPKDAKREVRKVAKGKHETKKAETK